MGGGAAAKTEMPALESERHPDLSIYLTPMPEDEYPWDKWQAAIVVEVVSPGAEARRRDYETKREEYLAAGVAEYWIVDPQERRMLALTRHGDRWRERRIEADGRWTTPLLPEFALEVGRVLATTG
jgi:Uma2 family endonuclease